MEVPMLEMIGGMFAGLLLLGLLKLACSVLDSASSRASTGIDLSRSRRLHTDWRVIESLSAVDAD